MASRQPLLDPVRASPSRAPPKPINSTGGAGGWDEGKRGGRDEESSYQAVDSRYQTAIDGFQKDLRRLDNLTASARRALEDLGTARESKTTRQDATRLINDGKSMLKSLSKTIRDIGELKTPRDRTERSRVQMEVQKLTKDLQERMSSFQKVAQAAESREREATLADRRTSSAVHSSEDEDDREAERTRFQHMQAVEFNDTIVEERAEAIADIHKSVLEVNELFRDIAVLVEDQSRDIDNIELNINEGHTKTADGVKQLEQAMVHQNKSRGKIIGLLVCVILIAGAVAVIVVLKLKK